ncbi:MAG TPA: hypothetical protein DDY52_00100 [Candidatus Moranbacteria bacterium]|nr:MAG: hypothetical protein UR51_C0011G0053 [Candidatus Moranbacteria bacterium GW2011_GWF1_34_10]HBI16549.1 hypothetical protein [Candidatus Moranbacteria bacterium]
MRRGLWWFVNLLVAMLLAGTAMAEETYSYKFKDKDTLWSVARNKNTTVGKIKELNPELKGFEKEKYRNMPIGLEIKLPIKKSVSSKPDVATTPKVKEKKGDETIVETGDRKVETKKPVSVKAGAEKVKTKKSEVSPKYVTVQKDWGDPGGDKYKGIISQDLPILGYSIEDQKSLLVSIRSKDSVWAIINPEFRGGLVVDANGNVYKMVKMLAGGGDGRPVKILTGRSGDQVFLNNKKNLAQSEAGRIFSSGNNFFLLPYKCNNPTLIVKIGGPPVITPPSAKEPPKASPPITKVIPPVAKAPPAENPCLDNWDWYLGGGLYNSRVNGRDNNGGYGWTKFRARPCPLWFTPEENVLGIKNVGLGFVVFLAGGDGIAAKYYDYNWHEVAGGATAKVYAKHSDYDFDLMIGRLWNEGSWRDNKDREQVDDFFLVSVHANIYRDDPDALWLHKFELNAEGRFPFHTEMRKGTKVNNRVVEGTYTQWIYKFKLGEDDSLNLSPGFNLGLGYEWASEEEGFGKIGPAFELASYDNVMAGISVLNYKTNNGGQWHPIGGYVSPDGMWRAYEASQITSVSEEDLKGLENGSKPLANPADYL